MPQTTLAVEHLHAWQDTQHFLRGISFAARQGEMVCLLNPCAHTRRRLMHSLIGLETKREGSVRIHNTETLHFSLDRLSQLGLSYCSKRTGILPNLSSEENLLLQHNQHFGSGMPLNEIYDLVPSLRTHKDLPALHLPVGVSHLLCMAKALRHGADLLVIRDLLLAMTPHIAQQALSLLHTLKARGYTLILSHSSKDHISNLADQQYLFVDGQLHGA